MLAYKHYLKTAVALAAVLITLNVCKYIKLPNDYSASHLAFDYSFGFICRGLVGQIISFFVDAPIPYAVTLWFAYITFAIEIAFLVALLVMVSRKSNQIAWLLALYFTSYTFSFYMRGFIGYLDHVLFVLAIIIGWMRIRSCLSIIAVVLLSVAGVCIHEIFLVMLVPVLVVRGIIVSSFDENASNLRHEMVAIAVSIACSALAYYVLSKGIFASGLIENFAQFKEHTIARYGSSIPNTTFDIFLRSTQSNLNMVSHVVTSNPAGLPNLLETFPRFLPTMLLYSVPAAYLYVRSLARVQWQHKMMALMLVCAPAVPLVACFLGVDFWRWGAQTNVLAYILLAMVACAIPRRIEISTHIFRAAIIALVAIRIFQL